MSVVNAIPLLLGDDGYQISRSVRLRSSASGYFSRTPGAAGNQQKFTYSGWVKRGTLGVEQCLISDRLDDNNKGFFSFTSGDAIYFLTNNAGPVVCQVTTTAVFRDPSAWYHVVLAVDTTQATATSRVLLYVNGVSQTLTVNTQVAQNTNLNFNLAQPTAIGRQQQTTPISYFDGYLTEINFIDGQALTPASFGQNDPVTGVWQPKKYAGTYGTNGFYLNFKDPSSTTTIGYDYSGNANNWTSSGVSVTAGVTYDSMVDVPTMGALGSNYCVLNPLDQWSPGTYPVTMANGNLQASASGGLGARATMPADLFNSYWEASYTVKGSAVGEFGFIDKSGTYSGAFICYASDGRILNNGSNLVTGLTTYTTGDVIGVALNSSTLVASFYKNGTLATTYTLPNAGIWTPACFGGGAIGADTVWFNFGQRPFAYTPPTGFLALNTQNLPDSTIKKGSSVFQVVLDTGANIKTSCEALFTYFVEWIKDRANANNHQILDTVRGTTAVLQSNTTGAETTYTAPTGNSVGWVWNLGAAASSNTAGSITSQVAANVSAGISEVTYTGTGANATVGHGLGVAPKMVIVKPRQTVAGAGDWQIWHTGLSGAGYSILLNSTAAQANSGPATWNSTAPTSTVFSLGTNTGQNNSGTTFVGYCFSEVPGFSKFGSYTGNGSADGPFIYTGFRPKFILLKDTSTATYAWYIWDTARATYNAVGPELYPNLSSVEATATNLDIVSNGFKVRSTGGNINANGSVFIYAAFAESPFKNSLAR